MLEVTLYSLDPGAESDAYLPEEPIEVPFVSLVNGGTHGAPALVAPGRQSGQAVPTVAKVGDEVLYINTALVPVFKIKRLRDR